MSRQFRALLSLAVALIILALLTWQTIATPPPPGILLPSLLFVVLVFFTNTFGVPLGGGRMSLLPMTAVAAYLVLGLLPAGWVSFLGVLLQEVVRYHWAERLEMRREPGLVASLGLAAANIVMQTSSILAAGAAYQAMGGASPLQEVGWPQVPLLLVLGLSYVGANYLLAGLYIAARSRDALRFYLRSLPNLFLYEAAPLVFAPLTALVYTRLGIAQFAAFAAILVISSLIIYSLAATSRRLERRVKELDSLQAVGRALSATLDLERLVGAIYEQVRRLMPAHSFYIALYDPETEEVSFPLAIEDDKLVRWRSRRMGQGLTEYILRTRAPLLIQKNLPAVLEELGVAMIGRPATSWLGVPLLAGPRPLGVIAVQSYSADESYDRSHQDVLDTIAAQAAVAIENARLYARTDQALARRVQELDSILRTTREGLLLLDPEWRVLAANRALAELLGVAQGELAGQSLLTSPAGEGPPLLALLGYDRAELQAECEELARETGHSRRQRSVVGPAERSVERTLTPVRDQGGTIVGWLLVLRDLTEERQIERMREELTHLLVHDLRSPLTVMKGSLDTMRLLLEQGDQQQIRDLLSLARRGNEQLLRMVNELLDVSQLESERMPVHPEVVEVRPLLEAAVSRLAPLAGAANVTLEIAAEPDVPLLYVDPALIGRVLGNLLDNAVKFTPDGGRVRLWARPAPDGDVPALLVSVSDSGPGIPPESRDQLFKKFGQVSTATGRRRGTGLGLYFCKLAVEAHGGQIGVESVAGQGCTLVMRLPVSSR